MDFVKFFLIVLIVAIVCSFQTNAQEAHDHDGHEHEHGETHSHDNEISIAVGVAPIPNEETVTAGFHLHYVKGLGKTNRFGMGIGLESILDEHRHYTASVVFQYRVYKG